MRRIQSWTEYFDTFERTSEMTAKLEAFCAGRETTASLEAWAHALWKLDGTQDGPLRTNSTATAVLIDLHNANESEDRDDSTRGPMFRTLDALECLRELRRGGGRSTPRELVSVAGPMSMWTATLGFEPIRGVLAGLGWFEFLRFASPGSGRAFVMRNALSRYGGEEAYMPTIATELEGAPAECLVDLLETLGIDRSDLTWVADEFEGVLLPEWAVYRQDDNGVRTRVASFTGYRKARAALSKLEAGKHKQTYWVEREPAAE